MNITLELHFSNAVREQIPTAPDLKLEINERLIPVAGDFITFDVSPEVTVKVVKRRITYFSAESALVELHFEL